jgi:hypothetical protein
MAPPPVRDGREEAFAGAGDREGMDPLRRSGDFQLKRVGGQDLLVPLGAKVRDMNALVTLNATGRRVWELLAEERSSEGLIADVAKEFGADPEKVRADVLSFVEKLGRLGLLES